MDVAGQVLDQVSSRKRAAASGNGGSKVEIADNLSAHPVSEPPAQQPPQQNSPGGNPPESMTEKVRKNAASLRNALAFTQAVGVLMRSPHYKQYTIGDLEWLLIPPLIAGQFRIGEAKLDEKQGGGTLPVAVVLWASVSPEVDQRLMNSEKASVQLKPEEWKSGDIAWLVHAAGETRFVRTVVAQMAGTTFKGRQVKVLGRDKDGNTKVHMLEGTSPPEQSKS